MSEIKPALTAEEWAERPNDYVHAPETRRSYIGDMGEEAQVWNNGEMTYQHEYEVDNRHALAALALHGQPFGFTWEDVDALLTEASVLSDDEDADPHTYRAAGRLSDLADRIAALLPPR